jgi:hypothetical protein
LSTFPTNGPITEAYLRDPNLLTLLNQINRSFSTTMTIDPRLQRTLQRLGSLQLDQPVPPGQQQPPVGLDPDGLVAVGEELRVQGSLERRWRDLVRTVAPEAGDQESIFSLLELVISQAQSDFDAAVAAGVIARMPPPARTPRPDETRWLALPPQFEQSLEEIVRSQILSNRPPTPAPVPPAGAGAGGPPAGAGAGGPPAGTP